MEILLLTLNNLPVEKAYLNLFENKIRKYKIRGYLKTFQVNQIFIKNFSSQTLPLGLYPGKTDFVLKVKKITHTKVFIPKSESGDNKSVAKFFHFYSKVITEITIHRDVPTPSINTEHSQSRNESCRERNVDMNGGV